MKARVIAILCVVLSLGASAHAEPEPTRPAPLPYVPPAPGYEEAAPLPANPPAPVPEGAPAEVAPALEAPVPEVAEPEAAPGIDPALADAWSRVEPRTIGALLPLTGAQAQLGSAARDAIELALAGTGVRLIVRDTASDPARAAAEADKLVTVDRVTALLGPIARAECEAAAAVSRRFVVPHVVLASVIAPSADKNAPDPVWTFRTSPRELAQAVARHARDVLAVGRVAIVHPTSEAGHEAARGFADEVTRLGGVVVHTLGYAPGAMTAKTIVQQLLGAKRPGKKVAADFDAVFVPDRGPAALPLVSELAAWGVPLRRTPGAGAGRVQILGMSGWATPLIIDRTTALTESAVFAESWAGADSGDPGFAAAFEARYRKPPVAFHAEAYDAATFLASSVRVLDGGDQTLRLALVGHLATPSSRVGATGTVVVDGGRVLPRVHLMTVQGTAFRSAVTAGLGP